MISHRANRTRRRLHSDQQLRRRVRCERSYRRDTENTEKTRSTGFVFSVSSVSLWLKNESASTTFESALVMSLIMFPVTFGIMMLTGLVFTWGGVVHLTRVGAAYAATHCYQDSVGSNVQNYMLSNLPVLMDSTQLTNGPAVITVQYWTQDRVGHQTIPFVCGSGCSLDCTPDAVTVTVSGYQFSA